MRLERLLVVLPLLLLLPACNRDPRAASKRYVDIGNKYYSRDKYKEASILYRKALQKDLKNPDAYYHLALVDLKQRQIGEAARSLQRAVQLDPSNVDASSKLADLYLASYLQNPPKRKEELAEVRSISAALLKKNPRSYDGLRLKGFLALADKDIPGAIQAFEAARKVKPNQPDLILTLCQTLVANNQADYAESLARQLAASNKTYGPAYDFLYGMAIRAGKTADGEAILKQKIASNPSSGGNRIELAAHYLRYNERDQMKATVDALATDKNIHNGRVMAGDFYMESNQPEPAMAEYQQGERESPKDKSLYQKREARVLVAQGKLDEAAKLADQIIQRDPKDTDGIVLRAALRMRRGSIEDINSAIKDLQGVVDKSPDAANSHQIHFDLGRGYLARYEAEKTAVDRSVLQSDLDQARIQFEEAIQDASGKAGMNFTQAKLALAQVYIYKGDGTRAVQLANDVLNNEPNNLSAMMVRSSAEVALRKFNEARADLETVLKARPNDKTVEYQLAVANSMDGQWAAADQEFEALDQAGDPRGMLGLIDSKNKQHKFDESMKLIEAAMPKAKNQNFYRYMLANTEAMAGKYDDAIENFNKLMAGSPKSVDLSVRLAETYVRAGKTEQALAMFSKAHELAPNEVYPTIRMGVLDEQLGRTDQARQQYEEALKIQPDNPVALNNLAYIKAESGTELDQALTLAQRASQRLPDDANIKDTLAYIYTKKGLTDEGLRILREVVNEKPANASFRYHLALALFQKGDKVEARKELATALEDKPSGEQARKIKELMAKVG